MGHPAEQQFAPAIQRALAGLIALMLAACNDMPAEDGAGYSNTSGPRIVSLNPCLDAILVEIAESEQILALSHYSRDPSSSSIDAQIAERFDVTGGTAEEIIALRPDIVFASTFIPPATKAALERLDVRVETFGSPVSLDDSLAQIERLAAFAGREREGKALKSKIMRDAPVLSAEPAAPSARVSVMLWQPGQIVAGQASLVWEHLGRFGFSNHAEKMGLHQADHVTLEAILADPPDLLLVAGNSDGQTHPLLRGLEQTRVARFEPNLFYCGGPSIPKAWKRLEEVRMDYMLNPPGIQEQGAGEVPGHHAH